MNKKHETASIIKGFILGITAILGMTTIAWNGPVSAPPNGNTYAPINISSASQTKSGAIWASSFLTTGGGYFGGNVGIGTTEPSEKLEVSGNVRGTGLCISGDCRTSWPSSGGGLGNWETKSMGTVYQAPSDGFVVGRVLGTSIYGHTDGNNPPTTLRTANNNSDVSNREAGIMMPVRKNDYWDVVIYTGGAYQSGSELLFWIPIQ